MGFQGSHRHFSQDSSLSFLNHYFIHVNGKQSKLPPKTGFEYHKNHQKAHFTGSTHSFDTQTRTVDLGEFSAYSFFWRPKDGMQKTWDRSRRRFVTGLLTSYLFHIWKHKSKRKNATLNAALSGVVRGLTLGQFPSETKTFAWSDSPKTLEKSFSYLLPLPAKANGTLGCQNSNLKGVRKLQNEWRSAICRSQAQTSFNSVNC